MNTPSDLTIHRQPDGQWCWRCWLEQCGGETKICPADTVVDDAKAHHDLWHTQGGAA